MNRVSSLNGLGAKSEALLAQVGIRSVDELRQLGAVEAYRRVRDHTRQNKVQDAPIGSAGLNLLYAMVGGLGGRAWQDVAKHDKYELLMQLAAADEQAFHEGKRADHEKNALF